jgi:hypothetical protein
MELIAHTTSFEVAAGVIAFLMGACVGPWLAQLIYNQMKQRRN